MTKAELIEKLAEEMKKSGKDEVSKALAGRFLAALSSVASSELLAGGHVTLQGIGCLKTVKKAERTGRNPQTGASMKIKARTAPKMVFCAAIRKALKQSG
jgi:DNA-binding protein HU-beta